LGKFFVTTKIGIIGVCWLILLNNQPSVSDLNSLYYRVYNRYSSFVIDGGGPLVLGSLPGTKALPPAVCHALSAPPSPFVSLFFLLFSLLSIIFILFYIFSSSQSKSKMQITYIHTRTRTHGEAHQPSCWPHRQAATLALGALRGCRICVCCPFTLLNLLPPSSVPQKIRYNIKRGDKMRE
jgi:hypothetical protein